MKGLVRLLAAIAYLLAGEVFLHAQVPEKYVRQIIYVNNQDPNASDSNPGSARHPFKTIGKATEIAVKNNQTNVGTKIFIYPGTYREAISLQFSGKETAAPIIFEGTERGRAVISGSDVWTDWKKVGDNIYSHHWFYKWGLAPYPPNWAPYVILNPIVRRREIIFANGKLLEQVLSYEELNEGSFYVSEENAVVYIKLPSGTNLAETTVEVGVRSGLVGVSGKTSVTLRKLTFQHDNTPVPESAVRIVNSSDILVEDCEFLWNNWTGLGLTASKNVVGQRNVANHNGGAGMSAWKIKNLLFEDNETSYNNWRGAKGGFIGWAVAGTKHMLVHNGTYRRHRSVGNKSRGFWLDFDNADILVEEAFWCQNLSDGIFIEASQGPIAVKNSVIGNNGRVGVSTTNSRKVTLENNILYGNGRAQITVTGNSERSVSDWETQQTMLVKVQSWIVKDNVIAGQDSNQILMDTANWEHFLGSLTSTGNLWYKPGNKNAFKVGGVDLDFAGWQSTSGQDRSSVFTDPRFTDAENCRFDLLPDSPLWAKSGKIPWGGREPKYRGGKATLNVIP